MSSKEAPLKGLINYLPDNTYQVIENYLHVYKIHLTISRQRSSVLGDFRHRTSRSNHRISINSNLNPYAFLITLLHELAHLLTFEQFGNRVAAHGREWKSVYAGLLKEFIGKKIFPADVEYELITAVNKPAASSCAEDGLIRVLRNYDYNRDNTKFVEEIPANGLFALDDGRIFRKGEKQRKRFQCLEMKSGKIYLFSPVHEVKLVS